jgi:hypothetical protein
VIRLVAAMAAIAAGVVGCGRDTADGAAPPVAPAAPAAEPSALPADHLGDDELVEGRDQAFGVPLPRGALVERRYVDMIQASGPMSVRALVKYFQARLKGGSLREGSAAATFEHVSQPGAPDAELLIHVEASLGKTRIDFTSFHRQEAAKLPDETSRWRSVGLTPDGKIPDPTHLE